MVMPLRPGQAGSTRAAKLMRCKYLTVEGQTRLAAQIQSRCLVSGSVIGAQPYLLEYCFTRRVMRI